MPKWEYLIITVTGMGAKKKPVSRNGENVKDDANVNLSTFINQLGEEGWELAGVLSPSDFVQGDLFFKRPKQ